MVNIYVYAIDNFEFSCEGIETKNNMNDFLNLCEEANSIMFKCILFWNVIYRNSCTKPVMVILCFSSIEFLGQIIFYMVSD